MQPAISERALWIIVDGSWIGVGAFILGWYARDWMRRRRALAPMRRFSRARHALERRGRR